MGRIRTSGAHRTDHPIVAGIVGGALTGLIAPALLHQEAYGLALVPTNLQNQGPARPQVRGRCRDNTAVGVQTVHPAVQRIQRLVVADLRRQRGNLRRGDIGRIGDDQVETRSRAREHIQSGTGHQGHPVGQMVARNVAPGRG